MSLIVGRHTDLRTDNRNHHAFEFDLPRYHQHMQPNLSTKRDIVSNALDLLHQLGILQPRVGIVAAVETVNPAIPAGNMLYKLVIYMGGGRMCRTGSRCTRASSGQGTDREASHAGPPRH